MSKLSPDLILLLQEQRQAQKSRSLDSPTEAIPRVTVHIQFEGSLDALLALGLELHSQTGPVAVGTIGLDQLEALSNHPQIIKIDRPFPPKIALDKSIPDINADQVWTRSGDSFSGLDGEGVIVGIIDTGIDFTHKTFRKADGKTRILTIWDQTLTPTGSESSPGAITHSTLGTASLGYGVEYEDQSGDSSQPTINKALSASDPSTICRHRDDDGHGTHVASTAAGNGSQSGNCHGSYYYIGVAPEADIIFVRLRGLTDGDPATTGTELIDAMRFIADRAGATPCAINLSLGSTIGARDGSSSREVATDAILNAYSTGFAIVYAAGNEGNDDIHAAGTVASGGSLLLEFDVAADSSSTGVVDVYYTGTNLRVRVQPQGGSNSAWVTSGSSQTFTGVNNGGDAQLVNNANNLWLQFTPPAGGINQSGEWILELDDTTSSSTDFHAWCAEAEFITNLSDSSTIMANSSADNIIVVGAYAAEGSRINQLAPFSSKGPILRYPEPDDRNIRPHITAPGVAITAAGLESDRDGQCCCACCKDYYKDLQGTSMASPHVTGAVALILQQDGSLSYNAIRELLKDHRRRSDVPGSPSWPNNEWGWGKLDVKAATDAASPTPALRSGPAPAREPASVSFSPAVPPGVLSMRDRLMASAEGRRYYDLFYGYFREVRDLINGNKRVAVVWHRNGGQKLISLAMKAVSQPEIPLPKEMDGISMAERMANIAAILQRYGSDKLRADVDRHLELLTWLRQGLSPNQIVEKITREPAFAAKQEAHSTVG